MKFVKFLWNCAIAITIYIVFKENPEFKQVLIWIAEKISLIINTIIIKIR